MKLRIKSLKWTAGIPVAMLNNETAAEIGVHAKDRISIKPNLKTMGEILTIVDTIEGGIVKKNELGVSSEIIKRLNLRNRQIVDVNLAEMPESLMYIKKKLDGSKLSKKEIYEIIASVVDNSLTEAETALFVSAMYSKGMDFQETIYLIKAILNSGARLNLKRKIIVDKHCIGGIPGNRTTPILVSICAAAGLTMPKTSSRAITSAAGTADTVETIAKVEFSMKELKKIVEKTGACMVWGGSLGMVPADSKIIQIEKALKVDPRSQLLASIMAKKLAVGSKYILIDIPYGKRAKVTKSEGLKLKKDFEKLGRYFKRKVHVVLTKGDEPIGNGIGPALEMIDVIKVLDPKKSGPCDLEEKSVFLAGEILEMTGKAKKNQGIKLAKTILHSGKAYEKFKEIIKAQKGKIALDGDGLKPAKFHKDIIAKKSLKIDVIKNKEINLLARIAGCPVDKSSGIFLYTHTGCKLHKGDKILTIYSESKARLKEAIKYYKEEKPVITK